MVDHSKEAAIRARAYQLWVESGYADGYQEQHWRQAEREIAEREGAERDASGSSGSGKDAPPQAGAEARRHSDGVSTMPSVLDSGPKR